MPLTSARAERVEPANPPRPRVLVVDDDSLVRWALHQALREDGDVTEAATAESALRLVRTADRPWSAIIVDWQVDDGSGVAILEEARRRWPRGTRIVLASDPSSADTQAALDVGAQLVCKPFRVDDIVGRVRAGLRDAHHYGE